MADTSVERTAEEQLQHWHDELAKALKANLGLPWPNLIEWAEEAEALALKSCTKAGRARLVTLEQRQAAMEKLAAAWQKEAERARKDCADQAYLDDQDSIEFVVWSALARPLPEADIRSIIKTIRQCRHLASEAIHVFAEVADDTKKRITALHAPVEHMAQMWCGECSVRRSTGPKTEEWVAFIPHPCPTINALENKEA